MRPHNITLADDDPNALFLLNVLLSRMYPQSSVSMFSNAEDALVHILDRGADLVITNHGMGEMSGAELIRILRKKQIQIPVIMISNDPAVAAQAEEAGANAFVQKSISTVELEKAIKHFLSE
jgi:DNA-binding NarL/FixJ family response regulator